MLSPIYIKGVFILPNGLIDELHSFMANFLWGSREGKRKMD